MTYHFLHLFQTGQIDRQTEPLKIALLKIQRKDTWLAFTVYVPFIQSALISDK